MKILFVSPALVNKNYFNDIIRWINIKFILGFGKSLTFPILKALTPEKHDVEFVEGSYSDINYDTHYDLIGITTITPYSYLAYEIADEFRRRGVKVVIGGWHASALPEEAKQHADAVVIGEAEDTWPELINDFEKGGLKPFYITKQSVDPATIPRPRVDIFPKRTRISVQATRGCPYSCEFCSLINDKFGKKLRMRPIDDVIEDISLIPNKGFFFIDNSLTVNPSYTKELFRRMKCLNKFFSAYGNIDVLGRDEELLKIAKEAGCRTWYIGLESVCQKSIDSIRKHTNRVDNYISSIKKIHEYGMNVMGSFVLGFDNDTMNVFNETDEFIRKSEIDMPLFNILTPYPGTPLYDRLNSEGRILTRDWSKYDLEHVVFQPKNMSPEELVSKIKWIRDRQYNILTTTSRIIKSVKQGPNIFLETLAMNNFRMLKNLK